MWGGVTLTATDISCFRAPAVWPGCPALYLGFVPQPNYGN